MIHSINCFLSGSFAVLGGSAHIVGGDLFVATILLLLICFLATRFVAWFSFVFSKRRRSRRSSCLAAREFRRDFSLAFLTVFLVCFLGSISSPNPFGNFFIAKNTALDGIFTPLSETIGQVSENSQITTVSVTTDSRIRYENEGICKDISTEEKQSAYRAGDSASSEMERPYFVPNVVSTSTDASSVFDNVQDSQVEATQSPQVLSRSELVKPEKARDLAVADYPSNNKRIFAPMKARDVNEDFLSGRAVDNNSSLLDEFCSKNKIVSVGAELSDGVRKGTLIDNGVNKPYVGKIVSESVIEQYNYEMLQITESVQTGVLTISVPKMGKKDSSTTREETGSGFLFVYKDRYFAMTNDNVVRERDSDESINIVLPNNQIIHPTEVFCSGDLDIAVLCLNAKDLPKDGSVAPVTFADSDCLRVSNTVFAFGSPFGLSHTMTMGYVSSLRRTTNDVNSSSSNSSSSTVNSLSEFIQLDASINPGNSGGPLFNTRGGVVGMVTLIATRTGLNEGIAFAIPSVVLARVAKSLIDHKGEWRRSRLGVELTSATSADLASTSIDKICGAKIVRVVANSPALNAGLRPGDLILTFNGTTVLNDSQLNRMIALTDSREKVRLGVLRGNQFFELESSVLRSRQ